MEGARQIERARYVEASQYILVFITRPCHVRWCMYLYLQHQDILIFAHLLKSAHYYCR